MSRNVLLSKINPIQLENSLYVSSNESSSDILNGSSSDSSSDILNDSSSDSSNDILNDSSSDSSSDSSDKPLTKFNYDQLELTQQNPFIKC